MRRLEGLELGERRARDRDEGDVALREVDDDAVEVVGPERAALAAGLPLGREHEVVDDRAGCVPANSSPASPCRPVPRTRSPWSTRSQGSSRRAWLSWSRSRVNSFSLASSCLRAAIHCSVKRPRAFHLALQFGHDCVSDAVTFARPAGCAGSALALDVLERRGQQVELGLPVLAVAVEPDGRGVEIGPASRRQRLMRPRALLAHEAGAHQHLDVARDGLQRDREVRRHLRHQQVAPVQEVEDAPPDRVRRAPRRPRPAPAARPRRTSATLQFGGERAGSCRAVHCSTDALNVYIPVEHLSSGTRRPWSSRVGTPMLRAAREGAPRLSE